MHSSWRQKEGGIQEKDKQIITKGKSWKCSLYEVQTALAQGEEVKIRHYPNFDGIEGSFIGFDINNTTEKKYIGFRCLKQNDSSYDLFNYKFNDFVEIIHNEKKYKVYLEKYLFASDSIVIKNKNNKEVIIKISSLSNDSKLLIDEFKYYEAFKKYLEVKKIKKDEKLFLKIYNKSKLDFEILIKTKFNFDARYIDENELFLLKAGEELDCPTSLSFSNYQFYLTSKQTPAIEKIFNKKNEYLIIK